MKLDRSHGFRTVFIGFGLILIVFAIIVIIWAGTFLPGYLGEVFRSVAGLLGTPLIMEGSFCLIALFIVLSVNSYRREKEGDEYVSMDIPEKDDE